MIAQRLFPGAESFVDATIGPGSAAPPAVQRKLVHFLEAGGDGEIPGFADGRTGPPQEPLPDLSLVLDRLNEVVAQAEESLRSFVPTRRRDPECALRGLR